MDLVTTDPIKLKGQSVTVTLSLNFELQRVDESHSTQHPILEIGLAF